jgi:hypothetical protein
MLPGLIEIVSSNFVVGWARLIDRQPVHVYASLGTKIVGWAIADIVRKDLKADGPGPAGTAEQEGGDERGRGFSIVFTTPIAPADFEEIKVTILEDSAALPRGDRVRYDRRDPLQIFVLGSPRSGTSEMGQTLTSVLKLPWVGEGHAAPSFREAASALSGENAPTKGALIDFMRRNALGSFAEHAMRQTYYCVHASSSFLDKTPGVDMICAAPFLAKCFPTAKFIFMRRNGISNVLSRMKKFGGGFEAHCSDWAAAMSAWQDVRGRLPHFVEVEQEVMLEKPRQAADLIADYLSLSGEARTQIAASLDNGTLERTGAGIGRSTLGSTGWTEDQMGFFRSVCGTAMAEFNYALE